MRFAALAVVASALAVSASAQRLDHAGQAGLRLAITGEYLDLFAPNAANGAYAAFTTGLEAGPSLAFDDEGDEVSLRARWSPRSLLACNYGTCSARDGLSFFGGARKLVGREEIKTFLDAELVVTAMPQWLAGLHFDVGILWDPTRVVGMYAAVGAEAEIGGAFRFEAELTVGAQLRFDLFPAP